VCADVAAARRVEDLVRRRLRQGRPALAGALAAHCLDGGHTPQQVCEDAELLERFQALERDGVETRWPDVSAY
jgi:hypothetical protein